jgi:hypothetical protein
MADSAQKLMKDLRDHSRKYDLKTLPRVPARPSNANAKTLSAHYRKVVDLANAGITKTSEGLAETTKLEKRVKAIHGDSSQVLSALYGVIRGLKDHKSAYEERLRDAERGLERLKE